MNLLVIDIGSTSTKGSVYNESFALLASHRVPTAPQFLDDICVEQNPLVWKAALHSILSAVREKNVVFHAITVTAQRSSVFLADANGAPLCNAIMWQDRRTQAICDCAFEQGALVYQRTGLPLKPVFGAPKMVWLRQNKPQLYKESHKILTVADYMLYLLTGQFVTDFTYGNRSLLMNLHTKRWDETLLQLFGVPEEKLCHLVAPGSCCGRVSLSLARQEGIDPQIEVFTAGGDQQVAALGLGVFSPGTAEVTHGTGSFCIMHSDTVVQNEAQRLVCNVAAIPAAYILESTSLTTGAAYDWFLKQFYDGAGYAAMDEEITNTPPLSGGVVALPCFQGAGAPDWNPKARGVFYNLSLCTKRGDLARALLEGIAVEVSRNIELLEQAAGKLSALSLSGGLTSLPAFNQMQADIYNRSVTTYSNREATSAGAWMSWMKETGQCRSYAQAFALVRSTSVATQYTPYPEQTALYEALKRESAALRRVLW